MCFMDNTLSAYKHIFPTIKEIFKISISESICCYLLVIWLPGVFADNACGAKLETLFEKRNIYHWAT